MANDSLVAIVPDRFDGTAFESFHAKRNFFFSRRLLVNERVAPLIMAREKRGCRFAAEIAIDALLIHKKFPGSIVLPLVCFIGHGSENFLWISSASIAISAAKRHPR